MSSSPNSKLLQRTIELNYTNKKRSSSLKWIVVNTVLLLVFVYDLSCKCPGYTSILHYVELISAAIMAANLVHYAFSLMPSRAPKLPLSPNQQKLLGLLNKDIDSSFVLTKSNSSMQVSDSESESWVVSDAELSLSPRSWRSTPSSPPSPPSPHSPHSSPSPPLPASPIHSLLDTSHDHFIADQSSLSEYLKRWSERAQTAPAPGPPGPPRPGPPRAGPRAPPPAYHLAAVDAAGSSKLEESSEAGAGRVWRRLLLDPQQLTQWNLNLRLWIHATVLQRLEREVRLADEALAPYLEPFADQRYLLRRLAALAAAPCLSAYRWDGGAPDWEPPRPADAEILQHLVATYLAAQAPGERELRVVRVGAQPPHYALARGDEVLDVGRGRNNLLHTLLLLLAAAARRDPPALARTHLGPAGLNMLWIIGR